MVNAPSTTRRPGRNSFMISASEQIVPEDEHHEGENQDHSRSIERLHHPFRYGTAGDGLRGIKDQMAAIERWNRQEIEDADSNRQQRDELNQPLETHLG